MKHIKTLHVILLPILLLFSCKDSRIHEDASPKSSIDTLQSMSVLSEESESSMNRIGDSEDDGIATGEASPASPVNDSPQSIIQDRILIYTAGLSVRIHTIDESLSSIKKTVQKHNGRISSQSITRDHAGRSRMNLTIRVPSGQFFTLLDSLKGSGELLSMNTNSSDVTEEYVDQQIRLENRTKVRDRLLEILKKRTGKLEEILQVERELARVTLEIDQIKGRIRYLKDQSSYSTIQLTLLEPDVSVETRVRPVWSEVAQSFIDAYYLFFDVIAFLIRAVGFILPLTAIGGFLLLGYRYLRRSK